MLGFLQDPEKKYVDEFEAKNITYIDTLHNELATYNQASGFYSETKNDQYLAQMSKASFNVYQTLDLLVYLAEGENLSTLTPNFYSSLVNQRNFWKECSESTMIARHNTQVGLVRLIIKALNALTSI